MIKNFVLDTNVLLHDPTALFKFQDNQVIIPIMVIEELDHFKKELTMLGRNARTVSKTLDRLRAEGNLSTGVQLGNGGTLRVAFGGEGAALLPAELMGTKEDNHILAVALSVRGLEMDVPVVVISKDTNLRIKADALGLAAEDFENDHVEIEELYKGYQEREATKAEIDAFYAAGEAPAGPPGLHPNEYVVFRDGATVLAESENRVCRRVRVPTANAS